MKYTCIELLKINMEVLGFLSLKVIEFQWKYEDPAFGEICKDRFVVKIHHKHCSIMTTCANNTGFHKFLYYIFGVSNFLKV